MEYYGVLRVRHFTVSFWMALLKVKVPIQTKGEVHYTQQPGGDGGVSLEQQTNGGHLAPAKNATWHGCDGSRSQLGMVEIYSENTVLYSQKLNKHSRCLGILRHTQFGEDIILRVVRIRLQLAQRQGHP